MSECKNKVGVWQDKECDHLRAQIAEQAAEIEQLQVTNHALSCPGEMTPNMQIRDLEAENAEVKRWHQEALTTCDELDEEVCQARKECDDLRTQLAAAEHRIVALEAFLESEATCPCCEEPQVCSDDCTFATDCPTEYKHMVEVRRLLFLDKKILKREK